MNHLLGEGVEDSGAYRQGIFWCLLRGEEPHEKVRELQAKIGPNFQQIEIDGFDELMESLDRELEGEVWLPSTGEMAQTMPAPDVKVIDPRDIRGVACRTTEVSPHRRSSTMRCSVARLCSRFDMGGVEYHTPDGGGPGKAKH